MKEIKPPNPRYTSKINNLTDNLKALKNYAKRMYDFYNNIVDPRNATFFWRLIRELSKYQFMKEKDEAESSQNGECINRDSNDCLDEVLEKCLSYLDDVDKNIFKVGTPEEAEN